MKRERILKNLTEMMTMKEVKNYLILKLVMPLIQTQDWEDIIRMKVI